MKLINPVDRTLAWVAGTIATVVMLLTNGCGATAVHQPPPMVTKPIARTADSPAAPQAAGPTLEQRLRIEVGHWAGTPHRMGGNDHRGVDCSGFVKRVFRDLFNIRLPRTTAMQVKIGNGIAPAKLRAGDLVFFHPPDKIRHVGIYLGDGEFAHASATRGVTISRLKTPYWRNAYWTARRIIRT